MGSFESRSGSKGSKSVKNAPLLVKMRVNVGDPEVGLVGFHLVVTLLLFANVNADRERVQLRVSGLSHFVCFLPKKII